MHFEGVDSFFYAYVNGELVGWSQISHATSEFSVGEFLKDGENVLDVVVLKWSVSSYLECQDKFRFSGIFRSVYLLDRPKQHIEDYRIQTYFDEKGNGFLMFANESDIPESKPTEKEVKISFNADTGGVNSLKVGGKELLVSPLRLNILRYTDNERLNLAEYAEFDMRHSKSFVIKSEQTEQGYIFDGVIVSNCNDPSLYYTIAYEELAGGLKIKLKYRLADWVKRIPRIGFELALPKEYGGFSYVGFGPHESYIDKNCLCEYGYYTSTAEKNFKNYIRPQENGSHYATEYLRIDGAFSVTAKAPFSFSVLPFTSEQLFDTKHAYELKRKGITNICIDLAMRGVGTHSCGPELAKEFEVPRGGENEFTLFFE